MGGGFKNLGDIPGVISNILGFVFNILIRLIEVILEVFLYLMPIFFIFFGSLYVYWNWVIKNDDNKSFKAFLQNDLLIKVSILILTLIVISYILIRNNFFEGVILYIESI